MEDRAETKGLQSKIFYTCSLMTLCNVYKLYICKEGYRVIYICSKVNKYKRPAFKGKCLVRMLSVHPMRLHN